MNPIMLIRRFLLSFLFILTLLAAPTFAQVIAIKAGRTIDPATKSVQNDVIIIIKEKKIHSIGQNIKIPGEAKVIDLSNKTILPGLIDCHTHLCNTFDSKEDVGNQLLLHSLIATTADRALLGVGNARSMLDAGFTTVRDVGNAGNFADVALKKAINSGIILGPTLLVSGKIIAPFGGQFFLDPEFPDLAKQDYYYADTRDEMLKAIRKNIHFGVDWIKIIVDDYPYIYSVDDIRFMVEEAAKAGKKVAAHCVTAQGAKNAAEAGLASIEHGFEMNNEIMKLAKENGVTLCGTDLTQEIMDSYQFFTASHEEIVDRLKRAHKIGLNLVFGSDVISNIPGHSRGSAALSLIKTWVDAKIPSMEILQAMTINGAKLLEVDKERALLKEGFYADLIATDENPLKNINTLKNISFVMKDGKVVKHSK